jgi:hypothetical protein
VATHSDLPKHHGQEPNIISLVTQANINRKFTIHCKDGLANESDTYYHYNDSWEMKPTYHFPFPNKEQSYKNEDQLLLFF